MRRQEWHKGDWLLEECCAMRKIKEVLRLKWGLGLSARQVSTSLKIAHSTVGEYLKRAEQAGLDWPQAEELSEAELAARLFPPKKAGVQKRPEPDWPKIEIELRQKGVTRMLLWQEYRDEYLDGYSYSQFCARFRRWLKTQEKTVMRIPKKAGEEVQVDYAGVDRSGDGSQNGLGTGDAGLCGRIGRQRLYLLRSPSQSEPAQLDSGTCAHVCLLRGRPSDRAAGQSQGGGQEGLFL